MKRIFLFFIFLHLQIFILCAQSIDDSTCWEYFEITQKLRNNEPLGKDVWNSFLSDPAIQVYLKDQGVDSAYIENYRQIMEIVYMPKNENVLNERLKDQNKNWWTYIVNEYRLHEEEMKSYLQNLEKEKDDYFKIAYSYSYQMLPKVYRKTAPGYKVTIIPVHNDAHIENEWMVFSLMASYFSDLNKYGILAGHEFHHVLRPRMLFETEEQDKVVVALLQRILNEGSADLIDKPYEGENATQLLEFQRGYPESFIQEGKKIIQHIDSLLSSNELDFSKLTLGMLLDTWNTSGHIPGYYMANIIDKNGFKEELIAHIEDPFEFVYLYVKAAKKDREAYRLSDKTINLIKSIDQKYRKSAQIRVYEKVS